MAPVKNRFPKALEVTALDPYKLRIKWDTGETLDVDIEKQLRSVPALHRIIDPEVFRRVHIASGVAASSGSTLNLAKTMYMHGHENRWAKHPMKCFSSGCGGTV